MGVEVSPTPGAGAHTAGEISVWAYDREIRVWACGFSSGLRGSGSKTLTAGASGNPLRKRLYRMLCCVVIMVLRRLLRERIFIELMTSNRTRKASRKGSK